MSHDKNPRTSKELSTFTKSVVSMQELMDQFCVHHMFTSDVKTGGNSKLQTDRAYLPHRRVSLQTNTFSKLSDWLDLSK